MPTDTSKKTKPRLTSDAYNNNLKDFKKHTAEHDYDYKNDHKDLQGALYHASVGGYLEIATLAIKAGAKADTVDEESYPLQSATLEGHLDIVKLLVGNGADVNYQDKRNKMTPLHWAVHEKNIEMCDYFLIIYCL